MTPWEIWSWQAPGWPEPHPVVIVSNSDRAARKEPVEVLLCSTQRTRRAPELHEVVLDQADGLDWATLCKCDLIYAVEKASLTNKRGLVRPERRPALIRTIIAAHGWAQQI